MVHSYKYMPNYLFLLILTKLAPPIHITFSSPNFHLLRLNYSYQPQLPSSSSNSAYFFTS
jgi:hypothetical protein